METAPDNVQVFFCRDPPAVNGKDNDDEPVLDRSTGELKVTNRPGPKSAKMKQTKLIAGSPKLDKTPIRTETKIVDGQKNYYHVSIEVGFSLTQ